MPRRGQKPFKPVKALTLADLRALITEIERLRHQLSGPPSFSIAALPVCAAFNSQTVGVLLRLLDPILARLVGYQSLAEVQASDYERVKYFAIAIYNLAQILVFFVTYFFIQPKILRWFPNSVYTFNQGTPEAITVLRTTTRFSPQRIKQLYKSLQEEHSKLSSQTWSPYIILLVIAMFNRVFNRVFSTSQDDAETHWGIFRRFLYTSSIIGPFIAAAFWFLATCWQDWGRTARVDALLTSFNQNLNPPAGNNWQLATASLTHSWFSRFSTPRTAVISTTFNPDQDMQISVAGEPLNITSKQYYQALARVFARQEQQLFSLTDGALSIDLDALLAQTKVDYQAALAQELRHYTQREKDARASIQDLNFFNRTKGIEAVWSFVFEQNQLICYLTIPTIEQSFVDELNIHYPHNLQIVETADSYRLLLTNPANKNFSSGEAVVSATYEQQVPKGTAAVRAKLQAPVKAKPAAVQKQHVRVDFSNQNIVGRGLGALAGQMGIGAGELIFDSTTCNETTALIRPMFAEWLPDYCHFSYIAPELWNHLDDVQKNQVMNIVKSGQTFPGGILPGATGGVGVVQSNEIYTSILDGRNYQAHYKLKTSTHRYHGRLYRTAPDGRCRLYIFDGVAGHGH